MKIQYASDLHLEFSDNAKYIKDHPLEPVGDILVLAGDIDLLQLEMTNTWFWIYCSKHWKEVYWIPGNHEYYSNTPMDDTGFICYDQIFDNIWIVNNVWTRYEDVSIFFTTLWSHIDPEHKSTIVSSVNDYARIWLNGTRFTPEASGWMHRNSIAHMEQWNTHELGSKKVVVSHHVPTPLCNHNDFKDSPLNSAFTAKLDEYIEENNFAYWIYGHHHRNIPQRQLGSTKLLTNQLGYINYDYIDLFRRDAVISL